MAIRQFKTASSASARSSSPLVLAFDSDVLAGSTLVVMGGALDNTSYTFSNLSSVTDSRSNTWESATNQNRAGTPAVWFSYAMNADAGATTVTVNLSVPTENRYGVTIFELTEVPTSGVLEIISVGTTGDGVTPGTTVSTAATGTLSQADNYVFLVAAGAFGTPSNPVGYTSYLTVPNGGTAVGIQISGKTVSADTTITGTVTHESTANYRHALLAVLKISTATTYKYVFNLNSSVFTAVDGPVSADVWRNGTSRTIVAEGYDGLTPGTGVLEITGVPAEVAATDTVVAKIYNATQGTPYYVTGSVEEV